jgi:hypothetical protein
MSHRNLVLVLVLMTVALAPPASATIQSAGGLALGTSAGLGGQAHVTFSQIAQDLPFSARFSVGYWRLDPGDALDARHVFINANSNGDPTKSGHRWDLRFDVLRGLQRGPLHGWDLAFGPRYSKFRGDYDFVGGNETFYITSDQWGAGAALERRWPTGPETELMISGGFDWFANATLKGHDSAYSPDGSSVSPVDEYTWKDADEAIRQPRYAPRFVVGIQHHFGR